MVTSKQNQNTMMLLDQKVCNKMATNLPPGADYDNNAPWNDQKPCYESFWVPFVDESGDIIFYSKVVYKDQEPVNFALEIQACEFWHECIQYDYRYEFISTKH